jgi:hypothetical protein
MAKIYSVGVDEETSARIQQDIRDLGMQLGLGETMTASQYLRYVLLQHLHARGHVPTLSADGGAWMEGFKAGYSAIMSKMGQAFNELQDQVAAAMTAEIASTDG